MLDVERMQRNLGVTVDGDDGRATYTALFTRLGAPAAIAPLLGLSASVNFPRYDMRTANRLVHFLGQTALESGGFFYMREIWGPTAAQRRYEGNTGLGNAQAGDGRRYAGRGVLQVTGRANYRRVSRHMGLDVEAQPELMERPDVGLWGACIWWSENNANAWADADDVRAVSRLVNRGSATTDRPALHETDRITWTERARKLVVG